MMARQPSCSSVPKRHHTHPERGASTGLPTAQIVAFDERSAPATVAASVRGATVAGALCAELDALALPYLLKFYGSPTVIIPSSRYGATAQRHCLGRASDADAEGQSSVA